MMSIKLSPAQSRIVRHMEEKGSTITVCRRVSGQTSAWLEPDRGANLLINTVDSLIKKGVIESDRSRRNPTNDKTTYHLVAGLVFKFTEAAPESFTHPCIYKATCEKIISYKVVGEGAIQYKLIEEGRKQLSYLPKTVVDAKYSNGNWYSTKLLAEQRRGILCERALEYAMKKIVDAKKSAADVRVQIEKLTKEQSNEKS